VSSVDVVYAWAQGVATGMGVAFVLSLLLRCAISSWLDLWHDWREHAL
jgi:hypothetical protein